MGRYRKKPVVIEAFQWTGGPDQADDPEWIVEAMVNGGVEIFGSGTPGLHMAIATLEGTMIAQPGDWIIRGAKSEIYPCKPDIFAATYEPESGTMSDEQEARERLREEFKAALDEARASPCKYDPPLAWDIRLNELFFGRLLSAGWSPPGAFARGAEKMREACKMAIATMPLPYLTDQQQAELMAKIPDDQAAVAYAYRRAQHATTEAAYKTIAALPLPEDKP